MDIAPLGRDIFITLVNMHLPSTTVLALLFTVRYLDDWVADSYVLSVQNPLSIEPTAGQRLTLTNAIPEPISK